MATRTRKRAVKSPKKKGTVKAATMRQAVKKAIAKRKARKTS